MVGLFKEKVKVENLMEKNIQSRVYLIKRTDFRDFEAVVKAFNSTKAFIDKSSLDINYKKTFYSMLDRLNWLVNIKLGTKDVTEEIMSDYCNKLKNLEYKYDNCDSIGVLDIEHIDIPSSCISSMDRNGSKYIVVEFGEELAKEYNDYFFILTYVGEDVNIEFLKSYSLILQMLYNYKSDYVKNSYYYKMTRCGLHFDVVCALSRLMNEFVYLINCSSLDKRSLQWYDEEHIIPQLQYFDYTIERLPVHIDAVLKINK